MLPLRSAEESGKGLCPPDYLFTREPNLITTGDKWLPKPVGHLVDVRAGSRHLVHSTRGPACGPRLTGERLKIPGGTLLEGGTAGSGPSSPPRRGVGNARGPRRGLAFRRLEEKGSHDSSCSPKEPPKALAPKPVPPVLMQKTPAPKKPPPPLPAANYAMPARAMGLGSGATASSSEGAPPTEVNHFGFDESEVDYGDDDDRTPEDKPEDEELLEKTKTKVEAFLRAPPEMRKTLRSQAWKRCKSKLEELNFEFSTRPLPEMHPGKFEKDLKDGFTYAEAKQRQKGRQRAARHQRALAEMEGASFEDFPKSWSHKAESQI